MKTNFLIFTLFVFLSCQTKKDGFLNVKSEVSDVSEERKTVYSNNFLLDLEKLIKNRYKRTFNKRSFDLSFFKEARFK